MRYTGWVLPCQVHKATTLAGKLQHVDLTGQKQYVRFCFSNAFSLLYIHIVFFEWDGGGHKMEYCDCLGQKWCKKPMVAEKIEMSSNFSSCIFKTDFSKSWLQLREIAQVVQFVQKYFVSRIFGRINTYILNLIIVFLRWFHSLIETFDQV